MLRRHPIPGNSECCRKSPRRDVHGHHTAPFEEVKGVIEIFADLAFPHAGQVNLSGTFLGNPDARVDFTSLFKRRVELDAALIEHRLDAAVGICNKEIQGNSP